MTQCKLYKITWISMKRKNRHLKSLETFHFCFRIPNNRTIATMVDAHPRDFNTGLTMQGLRGSMDVD
jgi:hypothetical protein